MSAMSLGPSVPRAWRARSALWALVAVAALAFQGACSSLARLPAPLPVASSASAAFEEARAWSRSDDALARERARLALRRAVELAPEWVAPRRMLDLIAVEDLLGLEALDAHRRALAARPDDPIELYLAGRLEGQPGGQRFERAARIAPDFAWAQHGLGYMASGTRNRRLAIGYGERALALARDPWERTFFASTLARYYVVADDPRRAIAVLERRLQDPEIAAVDAIELSVQTALIELGLVFQPEYQRGWQRALRLLRESDLTDDEVDLLARRLCFLRTSESASLELQLALASRPGAARDRWRAELLIDQRPSPLALGLLRRGLDEQRSVPLLRAARFAAGQFRTGVDDWLADLPRAVLDENGLPRDATLRRVVELARALPDPPTADTLAGFGDVLLEAGWFREARAVAALLAIDDLDRALALEDQAAASQHLLVGLQRLVDSVQRSSARTIPPDESDPTPRVRTLDELLVAMAGPLSRANAVLGGETNEERLGAWLASSPRIDYAGLASIVDPGPTFSAADERAGRGREGESVPGLAQMLSRLGRFGLFGQMLGSEPDGTILGRLAIEQREGEHLGVPWSGTIAWCEGADLKSRAGRLGAEISGAALHEGFWVDIDSLRRERGPWREFERRFFGGQDPERVQRALTTRGFALTTPTSQRDARRVERCGASILLGEADRVRLAVLVDRRTSSPAAPGISLDELLEVTSTHEEGHLCDRARFLPLSQKWPRALGLLFKVGFNPERVAQRLEYRAQLVSMATTSDPRVPLVSVLRAAEGGGSNLTPHAAAYRDLLGDFLTTLDRELMGDPAAWPEVDPDFVLAHQLHLLGPEAVRRVARKLAQREGLFDS